jgi:ethanolamine utilization protein EutQ
VVKEPQMGTTVIRGADLAFTPFHGASGTIESSTLADRLQTGTFGAGIARYGEASIDWVVGGDEIMFVLEGTLHITVEGRTDVLQAGDSVWIPEGTRLTYGSPTHARVFYAIAASRAAAA